MLRGLAGVSGGYARRTPVLLGLLWCDAVQVEELALNRWKLRRSLEAAVYPLPSVSGS
jgi:hypothetical protein